MADYVHQDLGSHGKRGPGSGGKRRHGERRSNGHGHGDHQSRKRERDRWGHLGALRCTWPARWARGGGTRQAGAGRDARAAPGS